MPRAVIIGPPGSGKSTVASRLASLWGVQMRDTDADVVATSGREITDIFVDSGEEAFRAMEREAVAAALATHEGVLALGGGAILDPDSRERVTEYAANGGMVVFLDVGLAAAARRVGLDRSRPLLVGSPRKAWSRLMDERRPLYEALATVSIVTDHLTPTAIAQHIIDAEARADGEAR